MNLARVITISGRPGSGKTTIGEMLAKKMKYAFIPEQFEDCTYLPLFLNGKGYLKETELWFIDRDRDRHLRAFELINNSIGVVLDKPLIQNYEMIMATDGFNSQYERELCKTTLLSKLENLPKPHLFIDLKIGKSLLSESIQTRGREMESSMMPQDEQMLTQQFHHEEIIRTHYSEVPRIFIDRNTDDFITDPTAINRLHEQVLTMLV